MRILLVDNEDKIRIGLRSFIEKILADSIIEEANGVQSGLVKITEFNPEVVFLDVEMDDGTGFDLLKQVNAPTFQLIFTTAFNQYALQAIKFSALDYLMKPIDPIELAASLSKASQQISQRNLHRQLEVLMEQISSKPSLDKHIVLRDMHTTYFLKLGDIQYCLAEGSYTQVFYSEF
jgi:two-component system, LytTR family, response regulator